jgi:putative selenate reductase molybdopterin-binding subunit
MLPTNEPPAHAQVVLSQPQSQRLSFMAQAAEVAVDPETGQVTLQKVVSVQETGTIINALGHQGQIEGGIVQGVGYGLSEAFQVEDGRITNTHLGDYKIPTMRDVPKLTTINVPTFGVGPYGARSVAELPCVPTAPAISNAVADAIGAPIYDLPVTAERVLAAGQARSEPTQAMEATRQVPSWFVSQE